MITRAVRAAAAVADDVEWSIWVRDVDTGLETSHQPDRQLRTASVGKLILLVEVARQIQADPAYGDRLVERADAEPIADSGVLQHLSVERLSVADLAVLVGYASDNWAANLLLGVVGLPAVAETGRRLGLRQTELLDRVRRPRTAGDPPALSVGTAAELGDADRPAGGRRPARPRRRRASARMARARRRPVDGGCGIRLRPAVAPGGRPRPAPGQQDGHRHRRARRHRLCHRARGPRGLRRARELAARGTGPEGRRARPDAPDRHGDPRGRVLQRHRLSAGPPPPQRRGRWPSPRPGRSPGAPARPSSPPSRPGRGWRRSARR